MRVDQFYNRITYPLLPHGVDWAKPLHEMCPVTPRRILHAGCATGSQTRSLAYVFPQAEVVGVDFSEGSLALARKWLDDPWMSKVSFERADLTEPLTRFGKFDMVLSYGVLHHIPEVDRALENIKSVLESRQSPFFIFLYGKYGRARISHLQQALAQWQEAVPDLNEEQQRAALWETAKSNGTFAGPRGWLKYVLVKASARWRSAWFSSNADAYLNPYVKYYDLDDIMELCKRHGLRFGGFVRRGGAPSVGFPEDVGAVLERFKISGTEHLTERQRLSIADKLAAPFEYEFVCYPAS